MSEPACEHVEGGSLPEFAVVELRTTHGRDDDAYTFHKRRRLCAFCAGLLLGSVFRPPNPDGK